MPKLAKDTIARVVAMLDGGHSYSEIEAATGISTGAISTIKKKHRPDREARAAGRPRLLNARDDRLVVRMVTSGECDTAVDVAKRIEKDAGVAASSQTIRRSLRRSGLKAFVKPKKPLLRSKHIGDRYEFAIRHKDWTEEDWKRVVWSDETKINRFGSDGRKWGWKSPDEQLQSRHVSRTVKHGGGSLMVWGCMTAEGVGYLTKIDAGLDAELYCRILDDELMGTIRWYRLDKDKIIFQHDNDPKHKARITTKWLEDNDITVLKWPAQSPDLNPIEHLWELLKRRLNAYDTAPTGMLELWERVETEWERISKEECLRLIKSMPGRIRAVIKAGGGYTKY